MRPGLLHESAISAAPTVQTPRDSGYNDTLSGSEGREEIRVFHQLHAETSGMMFDSRLRLLILGT